MKKLHVLVYTVLLSFLTPVHALTIEIDYSLDTGFFNSPTKKSVMNAAAQYFSNLINDNLGAINIPQQNVSLPGSTITSTKTINSAEGVLTVFTGGVDFIGSVLGRGGPVWSSATGSRGQTGHTGNSATATDFAPLYGEISFDTTGTSWFFDTSLSTASDIPHASADFYSVALHELGHVLGLGASPSWDHYVKNGEFTGPNATALFGGNIALNSGSDHWANGTSSTIAATGNFETAMDPSITLGTRKPFTDLDIAALKDVGWEISSVPVPPAIGLFAVGLIALFGLRNKPGKFIVAKSS